MQNNSRLLIAAGLILCLSGMLTISACSNSEPRRDSQNIMRELDKAQRLYAKAVQLLGNTAFKVAGKPAPLPEPLNASVDRKITWVEGLNPQAIDAIDQAETLVRNAIKVNIAAPDSARALAQSTLAQVLVLKAHCEAFKASQARTEATATAREAHSMMSTIRDQSISITFLTDLTAMSNTAMDTVISETGKAIVSLSKAIQQHQGEIETANVARDKLRREIASLADTARGFRQKSDLAKGQESLSLFDKAMEYEKQADAKLGEMAIIEQQTAMIQATADDLNLKLTSAQKRAELAKNITAARGEAMQAQQATLDKIAAAKTVAKTRVGDLLTTYAATCESLSQAQAKALTYYEEAATLFGKAGQTNRKSPTPLASQASALVSAGDVQDSSLAVKELSTLLVDHASTTWSREGWAVPQDLDVIKQYVGDPATARKEGGDLYQSAAKLYDKAIRLANREHVWAYQAQAAKAYFSAAMLTMDSNALNNAKAAVGDALEGKQYSPYLADVVRLEKLIKSAN